VGPFVSGKKTDGSGEDKPLLACGVVMIRPWVGILEGNVSDARQIGNCTGISYEPAVEINESRLAYLQSLSPYQQVCESGDVDVAEACAVVAAQQRCLAGAMQIAETQSTFPVIRDAEDAGEFAAENAAEYLATLDFPARSAAGAASVGFKILGAARSLAAVSSAYRSCHA
jgi:hypothetical protein